MNVLPRPERAQPRRERLAVDELHRDEHPPAVLADLVHLDDVGMLEPRHRLRLAQQPRAIRRVLLAHELDRDLPRELRVVARVDNAHAAHAEPADHAKMADLVVGERAGIDRRRHVERRVGAATAVGDHARRTARHRRHADGKRALRRRRRGRAAEVVARFIRILRHAPPSKASGQASRRSASQGSLRAMRPDGRRPDQLRPLEISTGFQKHAEGSALVKLGDTWVLCAASVEEGVPPFLKGKNQGWLTAEYAMLPRSTHTRSKRDPGGRGKEIQRLIGRSLRAAVDLDQLGERTINVDCDVLNADGGTRVSSITGAWVACALAIKKLVGQGLLKDMSALRPPVAAVSVGIVNGEVVLDLPYKEDSTADVDMNVVGDEAGNLIEVQGTAEHATFDRKQLDAMLDLALAGIKQLAVAQRQAAGV